MPLGDKMKTFKSIFIVLVFLILLSLVASCAKPEVTSSIISSEAMNLLQSKSLSLIQGDASGTSATDLLNLSAASQPDLVVKSISGFPALPASIESGSSFNIITKVKNKEENLAYNESFLRYYLSANKSYSSEDIQLMGRRIVPIVRSKKTSTGSTPVLLFHLLHLRESTI